MDDIQSKIFIRGTEGGPLNQEVGSELVRQVARSRDMKATLEIFKTGLNVNLCKNLCKTDFGRKFAARDQFGGRTDTNYPVRNSGYATPNFGSSR
jgi:hypothetical protein